MAIGPDPVAVGIAASLARPGGNVTGSTFFNAELMAKRLQLLKEVKPSMTRAGVLLFRDSPANPGDLPIEQPTKFLFVLNRKTAQTFGISFP